MFSDLLIIVMSGVLLACSGNSSKTASGNSDTSAYQKINAETARRMMQESDSFILLDVRTEEEFRERHIEGAILIPDYELDKRAITELPDKNALILVYCRSGVRAVNACKILAEKGYTRVFNFGGIIDWPYETIKKY